MFLIETAWKAQETKYPNEKKPNSYLHGWRSGTCCWMRVGEPPLQPISTPGAAPDVHNRTAPPPVTV
jgi:hypothetical protein